MKILIHRSLHRHALFLGGDRELVMFSGLLAFITAMGGYSLMAVGYSLAFWLVSLYWCRKWAKADPHTRTVTFRYMKQQDFYPARTSVWYRPKGKGPWKK